MFRFLYVIFINLFRIPIQIKKMRHAFTNAEVVSVEERYAIANECIDIVKKTGKISTEAFGLENLPQEGGYMLYPNHQGKYDALGIVHTHKKPCSLVMDKEKSYMIFVNEVIDLLDGKRLDKSDVRQAMHVINEVTEEVKNGRIFILFPEGGYEFNNRNILGEFKPGCFKIALKSKKPIVPVALVDSYRAFNSYDVFPVKTQVHYLEPILYDEYKDMKTIEIAALVKKRIQDKLDEVVNVPSESH